MADAVVVMCHLAREATRCVMRAIMEPIEGTVLYTSQVVFEYKHRGAMQHLATLRDSPTCDHVVAMSTYTLQIAASDCGSTLDAR